MKKILIPAAHLYWSVLNKISNFLGRKSSHIVICGYPRSGTSLLYNMVSTFIAGFRCEEFEIEAARRLHRSGNFVTKFPLDVLSIDEIARNNKFKKSIYIIIVTRDIRDVITSRHPYLPDEYFIGYKNSWWPQDSEFKTWKYNAPGIEAIYKAMKTLPNDINLHITRIKYEDLVQDPRRIQEHIEQFIGIKFTGPFKDFHKWKDKHAYKYAGRYQAKDESLVRENKEIDASRVAKWKKRENFRILYDQFTFYPELFSILIEEGYENNKAWFDEIRSTIEQAKK